MPFRKLRNHVPNALTLANLLAGCLSILASGERSYAEASYFIFLAAFFDFADGFAARLLRAVSPIGKELDSLADMVSFGAAPFFLLFYIYLDKSYLFNNIGKYELGFLLLDVDLYLVPVTSFGIVLCSAWRLAKFNVDSRQTYHFIGLPTPANAMFIACVPFMLKTYINEAPLESFFLNTYTAAGLNIFLSYLLVSGLPLMSLKVRKFSFYGQRFLLLWLGVSLMLAVVFRFLAAPAVLLLYVLISQIAQRQNALK